MYQLMISFNKEEPKYGISSKCKEYLLPDAAEVCKVITQLSHLHPVITLCDVPVSTAIDVLKDFELKEV